MTGVKELEKVINNFLEEFDLTGEMSSDFAYYYQSDKITYSLVLPQYADLYYKEFITSVWGDEFLSNIDIFLVSLLHEVGHSETYDDLEDMDIAYADDMKDMISTKLSFGVAEARRKELYFDYFALPDEYAATAWAIAFIKENKSKCEQIWKEMYKAIHKFYMVNEIA